MRLVLGGMVAVMSLSLAACGDNGSSPTPSPTPTPTGTPTPVPTPTAVAYTTSETALQYTTEGGVRVANTTAVAPAMGAVFAFDPAPAINGYVYTLLNGTVNPSPSETVIFTAASSKTCDLTLTPALCFGGGFVFQQVPIAAGGDYYMSRFLAGPGNPLLVLSFTSFGTFQEAVLDNTATSRFDLRPFAYGVTSPAGAIPTTGTATFNGIVVGQATGNKVAATGASNIYKLSGTSQMVINYAAGTATLKLTIHGDAVGCGTTCPADINVTYDSTAGTLASGVLTFTLPGGGSAKYFLAGGAAATTGTGGTAAVPPTEVGGSFSLTAADPNEAGVTMVLAGAGAGLR